MKCVGSRCIPKMGYLIARRVGDKSIVSILKVILSNAKHIGHDGWRVAGHLLNELTIRSWAKRHEERLDAMREALRKKSGLCFSSHSYSLETAGLHEKSKIIHPYAFSSVATRVRRKWRRSSKDLSLSGYILKYVSKHDVEYLKSHTITYLSPRERKNYKVSFKDGLVLIGGRVAPDDKYIFVLDAKVKHLFAGKKEKGSFQHTSFFSGGPVACAGEMRIQDGKIVKLTLRSGHYRPTKVHAKVLSRFLADDARLGSITADFYEKHLTQGVF